MNQPVWCMIMISSKRSRASRAMMSFNAGATWPPAFLMTPTPSVTCLDAVYHSRKSLIYRTFKLNIQELFWDYTRVQTCHCKCSYQWIWRGGLVKSNLQTTTCGASFPMAPNSARVGIGWCVLAISLWHCQLTWRGIYPICDTHELRSSKVAIFVAVDILVDWFENDRELLFWWYLNKRLLFSVRLEIMAILANLWWGLNCHFLRIFAHLYNLEPSIAYVSRPANIDYYHQFLRLHGTSLPGLWENLLGMQWNVKNNWYLGTGFRKENSWRQFRDISLWYQLSNVLHRVQGYWFEFPRSNFCA